MISSICFNWAPCTSFLESIKTWVFQYNALIAWVIIGIIIVWQGFNLLADSVPKVESIKASILIPLAKKRAFKKLAKSASKADIRGNVNAVVKEWQNELPTGWIQDMDIEWVERESKNDFLNEGEIVLRIRPVEDQNLNFVSVVYHYLRKSFFPKTKQVIPETYREASVLFIAKKLIERRKKEYIGIFEDNILEPAIVRDSKIPSALGKYEKLDKHGFFTGTFLREAHAVATEARFTELRNQMRSEIADILKHIEEFIDLYEKSQAKTPRGNIPEDKWHRKGPVTDYGFLLVAMPIKVSNGEGAYVRRAQERANAGINRLYVFGTYNEKDFAKKVIDAIARGVLEYRLAERFVVSKDYRGATSGGIGALFVRR